MRTICVTTTDETVERKQGENRTEELFNEGSRGTKWMLTKDDWSEIINTTRVALSRAHTSTNLTVDYISIQHLLFDKFGLKSFQNRDTDNLENAHRVMRTSKLDVWIRKKKLHGMKNKLMIIMLNVAKTSNPNISLCRLWHKLFSPLCSYYNTAASHISHPDRCFNPRQSFHFLTLLMWVLHIARICSCVIAFPLFSAYVPC